MKSEDGTGSRHAPWVLKEMWDCHPTYFIQTFRQVTSVICFFIIHLKLSIYHMKIHTLITKVGKAPDALARVPEMMDTPPILRL